MYLSEKNVFVIPYATNCDYEGFSDLFLLISPFSAWKMTANLSKVLNKPLPAIYSYFSGVIE